MRYKQFREQTWSQRIGGPKTTGNAQDLAQSQQAIQQLKQAYQQQFGTSLKTSSEHRTREQQQALVQRYARGERGVFRPSDPSKNPEAEYFHLYSIDTRLNKEEEQWMKTQGWVRPDPIRDPVHYQYTGTGPTIRTRAKPTGTLMNPDAPVTSIKQAAEVDQLGQLLGKYLKDMGWL